MPNLPVQPVRGSCKTLKRRFGLKWAQIQPSIVYDETVLRDGLDAYKVLAMPHSDVLTEGVAQKVLKFQRRGGIVVGDEALAPNDAPGEWTVSAKELASGKTAGAKFSVQR